jgi:hypothetical protein
MGALQIQPRPAANEQPVFEPGRSAGPAAPQSAVVGLLHAQEDAGQNHDIENLKTTPAVASVEQLSDIAHDRVELIIRHLLTEMDIKESSVQKPIVRACPDAKTSFYSPRTNEIVIQVSSIDRIDTYGEEIFHWLRNQLKPKSERTRGQHDLPSTEWYAVEEFFGYAGRAVVTTLCAHTSLADLCAKAPPMQSASKLAEYGEELAQPNKVAGYISEEKIESLHELADTLIEVYFTYDGEDTINHEAFKQHMIKVRECTEAWRKAFGTQVLPDSDPRFIEQLYLQMCECFCAKEAELSQSANSAEPAQHEAAMRSSMIKSGNFAYRTANAVRKFADNSKKLHDSLAVHQDSVEIHQPGYHAASRFFETQQNPHQRILKLLCRPSLEIYMNHVFQKAEMPDTKSWVSGLTHRVQEFFRARDERSRLAKGFKEESFLLRMGINPFTPEGRDDRKTLEMLFQ